MAAEYPVVSSAAESTDQSTAQSADLRVEARVSPVEPQLEQLAEPLVGPQAEQPVESLAELLAEQQVEPLADPLAEPRVEPLAELRILSVSQHVAWLEPPVEQSAEPHLVPVE
jgi:hypothetical protein